MSQLVVQYYSDSPEFTLPPQTYENSAGYDVYAAETRTILLLSCECISIEIHFAIPEGFFWQIIFKIGVAKRSFYDLRR